MFRAFLRGVLMLGVLSPTVHAPGQIADQERISKKRGPAYDLAVTYTAERAKIAAEACGCFWLYGGSFSGGMTFYHGLGAAVNVTGEHASDLQPGVDLSKIAYTAGPRYTIRPEKWNARHFKGKHPLGIFGEALFGAVRGFDTTFPGNSETTSTAISFAYQIGGGFDWGLSRSVGVRLVEADYVHSTLPNNGNDTQSDLRLSAGVVFHLR